MKHLALVCCNQRDAAMLPIFIQQWRMIHPDIPLVLGNCSVDPVIDPMLKDQVSVDWRCGSPARSLMRAMLGLAMDYDVDAVWKLDVDCWHRSDYLTPIMCDDRVLAAGIQWLDDPHCFLGVGYAIRRSLLLAMECKIACSAWQGGEDRAMSWMARKIAPNQVHLLPPTTARRAQTDDGTAHVVHCGCYYAEENPRQRACEAMRDYTVRASSSASR